MKNLIFHTFLRFVVHALFKLVCQHVHAPYSKNDDKLSVG